MLLLLLIENNRDYVIKSYAFRSGFECVYGWPWQHDLSAVMAIVAFFD